MKNSRFIIIGIISISLLSFYPKSIRISVPEIFSSIIRVKELKTAACIGDTVLIMVDLQHSDTLRMNCKGNKAYQQYLDTLNKDHRFYGYWEGTFPKLNETVIYIEYTHHQRIRKLFVRKADGYYRFWDPKSAPFANTVFTMPKESIYKPSPACKEPYQDETEIHCSDGFTIAIEEFDKMQMSWIDNK